MFTGEKSGHNATSYDAWAESMEGYCNARVAQWNTRTRLCSIHRVPYKIRAADEDAYEPQMLSIGPYHRSNTKLQAMEDHKWRYVRDILLRNPEKKLCNYLEEMEELEGQIRSFYSERKEIDDIKSKELVEMMLLDACFLVQLFLNGAGSIHDPIYSTNCILPIISTDTLLLENQLPFFVLQRIFDAAVMSSSTTSSLESLALQFFCPLILYEQEILTEGRPLHLLHQEIGENDRPFHLLDLCHLHIIQTFRGHRMTVEPTLSPVPILEKRTHSPLHFPSATTHSPLHFPSAREMLESGITLRTTKGTSSMLGVELKRGILKIPPLRINYSTNSVFRNLIAWEQCHPMCPNYFTSYAIFMDGLINTTSDVALLKERGILQHCLGSDEDVCLLFNKLRIGIPSNLERNSFSALSDEVKKYQQNE